MSILIKNGRVIDPDTRKDGRYDILIEEDKIVKVDQEIKEEAEEKYGLCIMTAWTYADDERLKYQNDHAGANETSIVMAVRPELVDFGQVKEDESNLIGIAGRHPVRE